ncbi:MAG TPA: glycosyltransferase family 1 protein [Saprospiraceae bacterium]|nr:glycosyltransferase family 1 protein [Saprospiraceae bacterium]
MKVLAVTGAFLPDVGGMQYSTHQTLLALTNQGVEVELICPKHSESADTDSEMPYRVMRVSQGSYIAALHRFFLIRKIWKKNNYDQLLLMGHFEEIIYGLAQFLYPTTPIILAAGTRLPFDGGKIKKWIRNLLLCNAYKKAHKIIAISPATKQYIGLYCKKIRTPFFIIPRPIDGEVWKRKREKKGNDFTLVTFGRLEKAKNIQGVLQVVDNLRNKIPNIKYWIIGDGDYLDELKSIVTQLKLEDIAVFVGTISQSDVAKRIQDADICILLSKRYAGESFGRVYVEAAALGIPSIGYFSKGVTVAVNHGVTGFLCEVDDIACVENSVWKLYNDTRLMDEMKANATAHYQSKFTLEIVGKKFVEVLNHA